MMAWVEMHESLLFGGLVAALLLSKLSGISMTLKDIRTELRAKARD